MRALSYCLGCIPAFFPAVIELLPSGFVDQNKLLLGALFNPGAFSHRNRKVTNMKSPVPFFLFIFEGVLFACLFCF